MNLIKSFSLWVVILFGLFLSISSFAHFETQITMKDGGEYLFQIKRHSIYGSIGEIWYQPSGGSPFIVRESSLLSKLPVLSSKIPTGVEYSTLDIYQDSEHPEGLWVPIENQIYYLTQGHAIPFPQFSRLRTASLKGTEIISKVFTYNGNAYFLYSLQTLGRIQSFTALVDIREGRLLTFDKNYREDLTYEVSTKGIFTLKALPFRPISLQSFSWMEAIADHIEDSDAETGPTLGYSFE